MSAINCRDGLRAGALAIKRGCRHKRGIQDMQMTPIAYATFCLTCVAVALAPGPTVTVIIASSLRFGAKSGIAITMGTLAGMLLWLAAATLGLPMIAGGHSPLLLGLRYAGAAYVIWLGIKLLQSNGNFTPGHDRETGFAGLAAQGFAVILSNPKMFVMFGILIPPLLSGFSNPQTGTLLLGGTFVLAATICDLAYAFAAGSAGAWLTQRSHLRSVEIVSAVFLIGAGLWLALR